MKLFESDEKFLQNDIRPAGYSNSKFLISYSLIGIWRKENWFKYAGKLVIEWKGSAAVRFFSSEFH